MVECKKKQEVESKIIQIEWYFSMEKNLRVVIRLLEVFALLALLAKVISIFVG
ncbi:hypothetical protein PP175_12525 [Aneurinibacillus sp. Ricciae_BoGa-3]|uniref:hypothetical protein n=1 Tax=Aneurinibacillus sp. Ricciae_BoGa-3 TaxID=3022697 RepID=UPI0023402DAD|nr:hypothetical protein [Aneurinibacillus sp. Ricciae_BoGa-3]WCK56663.1 hypothetical protein PP175_12525 [Aneurinibacillus sp. Ricciae_BoGa-3]